jgi:hypothetical protein
MSIDPLPATQAMVGTYLAGMVAVSLNFGFSRTWRAVEWAARSVNGWIT